MAKKRPNEPSYELLLSNVPQELKGIGLLLFNLLLTLGLASFTYGDASANWLGLLGYSIAWVSEYLFGFGSYLIVIYFAWVSWHLLRREAVPNFTIKTVYFGILLFSSCIILTLIADSSTELIASFKSSIHTELVQQPPGVKKLRYHLGGTPFYYIYRDLPLLNLQRMLSQIGTTLVFATLAFFALLQLTEKRLFLPLVKLYRLTTVSIIKLKAIYSQKMFEKKMAAAKPRKEENTPQAAPQSAPLVFQREPRKTPTATASKAAMQRRTPEPPPERENFSEELIDEGEPIPMFFAPPPAPIPSKSKRQEALAAQRVVNGDYKEYKLPPLELLTDPVTTDQSSLKKDLQKQAQVLEETLASFGIEAKVGQICCGPTITSFEVHPAIGVKVQKIKALENDIALNLQAKSIRIIAPIPGKAAVGIEVPNPKPQEVSFKEMLSGYIQSNRKLHIPAIMGKTVSGEDVVSDLAKMPHCIIAGATGSGKSVCINTIVMSILMTARPDEIKLLMVDPKKVELTAYSDLPHLIAPVITEPAAACMALNWLVKEMEKRYDLLKRVGVRNIVSFNGRTPSNGDVEDEEMEEIPDHLPYIVAIIDELADLMMVSSQDIETPIARIAQMARAVGIHLILATQRPSREVLTGLIKANFPTRIAFKVASRVNSQIILDETGAEALLGNGDMLFLPPSTSNLLRAQGAFIRDEDINKVIAYITEQAPPAYLIRSFDGAQFNEGMQSSGREAKNLDSLYDQAFNIVRDTGNASTTFLQRKLKIGYARAASLMDQLEEEGVIGPPEGGKPRKILIKTEGKPLSPLNKAPLMCEDE